MQIVTGSRSAVQVTLLGKKIETALLAQVFSDKAYYTVKSLTLKTMYLMQLRLLCYTVCVCHPTQSDTEVSLNDM